MIAAMTGRLAIAVVCVAVGRVRRRRRHQRRNARRVRAGRRADRLPRRAAHLAGRVLAAGRLRRDLGPVGQRQPLHLGPLRRQPRRPDRGPPAPRDQLCRGVDLRRAPGQRLAGQPEPARHALPAVRGPVMRPASTWTSARASAWASARAAVLAAAVVALAAAPAHAQPADVAAQIKLIETQPADMDRATWKDRRRDAARKLGAEPGPARRGGADQARRDRDVRHHRRDRDRGPRQPRRSRRGAGRCSGSSPTRRATRPRRSSLARRWPSSAPTPRVPAGRAPRRPAAADHRRLARPAPPDLVGTGASSTGAGRGTAGAGNRHRIRNRSRIARRNRIRSRHGLGSELLGGGAPSRPPRPRRAARGRRRRPRRLRARDVRRRHRQRRLRHRPQAGRLRRRRRRAVPEAGRARDHGLGLGRRRARRRWLHQPRRSGGDPRPADRRHRGRRGPVLLRPDLRHRPRRR